MKGRRRGRLPSAAAIDTTCNYCKKKGHSAEASRKKKRDIQAKKRGCSKWNDRSKKKDESEKKEKYGSLFVYDEVNWLTDVLLLSRLTPRLLPPTLKTKRKNRQPTQLNGPWTVAVVATSLCLLSRICSQANLTKPKLRYTCQTDIRSDVTRFMVFNTGVSIRFWDDAVT